MTAHGSKHDQKRSQKHYALMLGRPLILGELGVEPRTVLRHARLPEDLFTRTQARLAPDAAERPFLTANAGMWQVFEPELQRRLADLDVAEDTSGRVRSALLELLPSGASSIEDVADRLAVSKRTLQRRLHDEGTNYQLELGAGIELVAADLESDDGWDAAVSGMDVIHHVASPFPLATPKDPMELISPARDGALRLLRAAKQAGIPRVILTSSCAAICYGYSRGGQPALCTESDWTDDDDLEDTTPYARSKTIAERAAWDFAKAHDMQLTTINPVAVFGPIRSPDVRTSVGIIGQLLRGEFPALPHAGIQVVDVRDVAAAHVAAMDRDETIGERYILADGFFTLREVAELLRAELPQYDAKLTKRDMPDFLVRLIALLSADMKTIAKEVGKRRMADGSKVKGILGRELTPGRDALLASAETLIRYGAV